MHDTVADIPRLTEEGLSLRLGDRIFAPDGKPTTPANALKMQIPPQMNVLSDVLLRQSKLLALKADCNDSAIYDAYGADLALLVRYRTAFKQTIDAAVMARASVDHVPAQEFLVRTTSNISAAVHEPTLDLGPNALRLDKAERLDALQMQYRADVESLKVGIAVWLHVLAESEYVCLLDWLNPTAVRYYFFRMESTSEELSREYHDPGMSLKGRHATTTVQTKTEVISERRMHTVVNAKSYNLGDFLERVPDRIARLVNDMPPEVRQFATIIGGTVTQEEVVRRTASSQIDTTTTSVWIDDPAVALFDTFAIAGYGGTAQESSQAVYMGHALQKANRWLIVSGVATLLLTGAASLEGLRIGGLVFLLCAAMTFFSQIGMRVEATKKP